MKLIDSRYFLDTQINSHSTTIVCNDSNLKIQSHDIFDISSNIIIQTNNEPKVQRSPSLYNTIYKKYISFIPVATDPTSNLNSNNNCITHLRKIDSTQQYKSPSSNKSTNFKINKKMRTDILNDPYLTILSTNVHQYITIPHDSSSSSGCTSIIHSKSNTISSLVTSQDKP